MALPLPSTDQPVAVPQSKTTCTDCFLCSQAVVANNLPVSLLPFQPTGQQVTCTGNVTLEEVRASGSCFWSPGQSADLELVPKLQQCLQGKQVYIVGTSVSRQWYFQMVSLMNANQTEPWLRTPRSPHYRAQQKAECGGGTESARESCKQQGMVFRWQNENIFDDDLANSMRSRSYDIIIANMGLGNIVHHSDQWVTRLLQQGGQLAALVSTLPNSTRFYWRTTTHICLTDTCRPDHKFTGCGVPAEANAMIDASNIIVPQLLLQQDPRARMLDVQGLTKCSLYDDHVHHPLLTIDHLLLFLSRECPQLKQQIAAVCPHLCIPLTAAQV